MRVGPHPHALRLDSLRSLAAAAGAHAAGTYGGDHLIRAESCPRTERHGQLFLMRVGPHFFQTRWGPTPSARASRQRSARAEGSHALRLDSLRSLAAAAGAHPAGPEG